MPVTSDNILDVISIHALREEGDDGGAQAGSRSIEFLSTPSARRATPAPANFFRTSLFLSTPSARRATVVSCQNPAKPIYFYPRPPRGGRLWERWR